jgi:hypothetical protein
MTMSGREESSQWSARENVEGIDEDISSDLLVVFDVYGTGPWIRFVKNVEYLGVCRQCTRSAVWP